MKADAQRGYRSSSSRRRPPASAEHVAHVVLLARRTGLELAVRGVPARSTAAMPPESQTGEDLNG
jgi:hypothetical protein